MLRDITARMYKCLHVPRGPKNDPFSTLFVVVAVGAIGMAILATARALDRIEKPNYFWPILFLDVLSFFLLVVDVDTHAWRMRDERRAILRNQENGIREFRRFEFIAVPFILYILLLANLSAFGWSSPIGQFTMLPEGIEWFLDPLAVMLASSSIWKIRKAAKQYRDLSADRLTLALKPYFKQTLRVNTALRYLIYATTVSYLSLFTAEAIGKTQNGVNEAYLSLYFFVLALYALHNSAFKNVFEEARSLHARGHRVAGIVLIYAMLIALGENFGLFRQMPDFLPHFAIGTLILFVASANRLQLLTLHVVRWALRLEEREKNQQS